MFNREARSRALRCRRPDPAVGSNMVSVPDHRRWPNLVGKAASACEDTSRLPVLGQTTIPRLEPEQSKALCASIRRLVAPSVRIGSAVGPNSRASRQGFGQHHELQPLTTAAPFLTPIPNLHARFTRASRKIDK